MRVSVVLPNFNGAGLLPDTLAALAAQSRKPDQIIVVDNASSDDSLHVLAGHPVTVVQLPRNLGFGAAANAGVRVASGELVSVLNTDARPQPTWLTELVAVAARSTPDVWAWGSVQLRGGRVESAGDRVGLDGRGTKDGQGLPVSALPDQPYEVVAPPGAAPLFRRELFLRLGGYHEPFFLYYEDLDLALRARLAGLRAVQVPTARVDHLLGASSAARPWRPWFYIGRNSTWCAVRTQPELHPRLLLAGAREDLRVARGAGFALPYLAGRLAALPGLPRALAQRREVQRSADAAARHRVHDLLASTSRLPAAEGAA